MAWKGVPGDERIFWSRSNDGLNWETPREAIPKDGGIKTIAGPAIDGGTGDFQRALGSPQRRPNS